MRGYSSWSATLTKMATVLLLLAFSVIHLTRASVVNVALGKPASVSSSWPGYRATTAVDGNTDAETFGANRIINTAENQPFAWWKVDLQREVQDATVRIYFRTDYAWRRNGVELYTSTSSFPDSNPTSQGQLCHTVTGDPSGSDIPDVYNVTCPGRWRYLLLYTDTNNDGDGPVLDFGEVEVLICSVGTYGEDCAKTCSSRNCVTMTTTCERDGRCPGGCQSGWTGVDCTQACAIGFYGPGCSLTCTDRKCGEPSAECDHVTGQCVNGCHPGFKGFDCTEKCDLGSYGSACSLSCAGQKCLVSSECDHVTGQCVDGCKAGYKGTHCRQACEIGFYGPGCSLICTDRKCGEPSAECDHVTGQCENGCHPGFKGFDCTKKCDLGSYGSACSLSCAGQKCLVSSECDHVTGQCVNGCKAGYKGTHCRQECESGQYGLNCAQRCGQCNGTCDHVLGHCPDGCLHGFCGLRCDIKLAEACDVNIGSIVAGACFGTFLGVLLLVLVALVCLIRQGRLQWVKSPEDKKPVQVSPDSNQMSNIAPQPGTEHAQSSSPVFNSDYGVLDPELMPGNKHYDVIEHKEYENA